MLLQGHSNANGNVAQDTYDDILRNLPLSICNYPHIYRTYKNREPSNS